MSEVKRWSAKRKQEAGLKRRSEDPKVDALERELKRTRAKLGEMIMAKELRLALLEFKARYNAHWLLQRYDWQTPATVRATHGEPLAA